MYFEKIPSGFSPFCTLDEKRMVAKYYTHNALNYDENNIETIEVGKESFIILDEIPSKTVLILYLGLSALQLSAPVIVPLF